MVSLFLCMLTPGRRKPDLVARLNNVSSERTGRSEKRARRGRGQILRGSLPLRVRFFVVWEEGEEPGVCEENGRAGYEDGGPGIRRLSAAIAILEQGRKLEVVKFCCG
jgi:hypothetical protein